MFKTSPDLPFVCDHPGCTKAFTRKDHLLRHAQNHSDAEFHCTTCHRAFARADLLARHEKRGVCEPGAPASASTDSSGAGGGGTTSPRVAKRRRTSSLVSPGGKERDLSMIGRPRRPSSSRGREGLLVSPTMGQVNTYTNGREMSAHGQQSQHGQHQDPRQHQYQQPSVSLKRLLQPSPSTFLVPTSQPQPNSMPVPLQPPANANPPPPSRGYRADPETSPQDPSAANGREGVEILRPSAPDWGFFNLWPTDSWDSLLLDTLLPGYDEAVGEGGGLGGVGLGGGVGGGQRAWQMMGEGVGFMHQGEGDEERRGGYENGGAMGGFGNGAGMGMTGGVDGFGNTLRMDVGGLGMGMGMGSSGFGMVNGMVQGMGGVSVGGAGGVGVSGGAGVGGMGAGGGVGGVTMGGAGGVGGVGIGIGGIGMGINPRRMAESAEREKQDSASRVDPGLLARLVQAYPDFDLTLSGLEEALGRYWTHVAPSFPFIHRGTFELSTAPVELVVMMAVVGWFHTSHSGATLGSVAGPGPQLTSPPALRATGSASSVSTNTTYLGGPSQGQGQTQGQGPTTPSSSPFTSLVQRVRGTLVQNCGLNMPISTLQAYALAHVHDTWFGSAESVFVAQVMWPVMVSHSRKKGIGVVGRPDLPPDDCDEQEEVEAAWVAWAKDEERRRAAFSILFIDTQISAFWSQHPSRQLSVFAHNLNLPCPRSMWEAPTSPDWLRARSRAASAATSMTGPGRPASRKGRTGYLPGLHPEFQVSVVNEGYSSAVLAALAGGWNEEATGGAGPGARAPVRVEVDNSLSVMMLLVGLLAIAWDCRTRGGMGIRFRDGTKHWRSIVLNAVVGLRAAYEQNTSHLPSCIETRDMRDTFAISIISVLSDIPMLQVAAGATTICGSSIGPRQYADAKRRLRLWAKTDDAWTCLWQSARYLRESLYSDWGIYSPWASFLSALVVWAYAWTINAARDDREKEKERDRERERGKDSNRDDPHRGGYEMVSPPTTGSGGTKAAGITTTTSFLDSILACSARLDAVDVKGVDEVVMDVAATLEKGGEVDRECAGLLWRLSKRR